MPIHSVKQHQFHNSIAPFKQTVNVPSLTASQRGASVSGIVFLILALGVFAKLAIAIIPAQIGDYQFTKAVANELKRANDANETPREFMDALTKQMSINADYTSKPEEMLTFTSDRPGALAVKKNYTVVNNFAGNVDIVNRFEGDIVAATETK